MDYRNNLGVYAHIQSPLKDRSVPIKNVVAFFSGLATTNPVIIIKIGVHLTIPLGLRFLRNSGGSDFFTYGAAGYFYSTHFSHN